MQVQFLTAEILKWHTEQQERSNHYRENSAMQQFRGSGAQARAAAAPRAGVPGLLGPGGVGGLGGGLGGLGGVGGGGVPRHDGSAVDPRSKMAGLHGEEEGPLDDAERVAVRRRNLCFAAPQPSGRAPRAGLPIFQSARRALSIRRNLSNRDHHDSVRRRPATVRVNGAPPPLSKGGALKVDVSKMSKEEAAREGEKLAREAARRAARRAATRAPRSRRPRRRRRRSTWRTSAIAQEQVEMDAQRVAQVARRAAVAREAAQAARRRRQPVFNVNEHEGRTRGGSRRRRRRRRPRAAASAVPPSSERVDVAHAALAARAAAVAALAGALAALCGRPARALATVDGRAVGEGLDALGGAGQRAGVDRLRHPS